MSNDLPVLRLMGRPFVGRANGKVSGFPALGFVLVGLLFLRFNRVASRRLIAAALWEDADETKASRNLRQLLFRIRSAERELGLTLIDATAESISLHPGAALWDVDQIFFQPIEDAEDIVRVTSLYQGEFLDGLDGGGNDLQVAIRIRQEELRDRFQSILLEAAERIGGPASETALRGLVELCPFSDTAAQGLIRHLLTIGEPVKARRAYEAFRLRLDLALQTGPEAETTALVAKLWPERATSLFMANEVERTHKRIAGAPRIAFLMPQALENSQVGNHLAKLTRVLIEDVTIGLAKVRSLAVIASHSAFQFSVGDTLAPSHPYDLDYIVQTQVEPHPFQPEGTALRLMVTLQRVDGEIVWMDHYPLTVHDGPARYADLTNAIVQILVDKVERSELSAFERTANPTAYSLYLLGMDHMRAPDLPRVRRARRAFRSALNHADKFAPAWSGLARTAVFEWLLLGGTDSSLLDQAQVKAQRAIEIDPLDGNAYRELGRAALFLGRMDESVEQFRMAERFAPNHADLLADYADTLVHNSDFAGANEKIDAALALNPLPPDDYYWAYGGVKFALGEYEDAIAKLSQMKNDEPALRLIAACAAMAGNRALAVSARRRTLERLPDFRVDEWAAVLPIRDATHREHYIFALKSAGFQ